MLAFSRSLRHLHIMEEGIYLLVHVYHIALARSCSDLARLVGNGQQFSNTLLHSLGTIFHFACILDMFQSCSCCFCSSKSRDLT
jgi:hypothetical protein